MSTELAIAGVTAVLRDLLNDGFVNGDVSGIVGGNVEVSALAPDSILVNGSLDNPQLNVCMYLVTPNTGWRNMSLPSTNSQGQRIENPPLALDLHYLLTAYGVADLQAEILLGHAMQLLHENPVFTRAAINEALIPSPEVEGDLPPALLALSDSGLADQVEQIKFTPEYLNTEEMSKLWTAMQSSYRLTAAYLATVVLIKSEAPTRSVLPVRERTVRAIPLQRPHIERVAPDRVETGEVLTLHGRNLSGEITRLRFGDILMDPDAATNRQITVTLPASMSAGVQGVQVVHDVDLGIPPTPHRGTESNVVPFILQPRIDTPTPIDATPGATLTLNVTPPVTRRQRVSILIGDREIMLAPQIPEDSVETDELEVAISEDFDTGAFLLRLRVDGAESRLTVDDTTGEYDGPMVNIS